MLCEENPQLPWDAIDRYIKSNHLHWEELALEKVITAVPETPEKKAKQTDEEYLAETLDRLKEKYSASPSPDLKTVKEENEQIVFSRLTRVSLGQTGKKLNEYLIDTGIIFIPEFSI